MTMKWNGAQTLAKVKKAANRGVLRGTEGVKEEALSLIANSPATGRTYQRRGVTHVASSPGNPPRNDTGTLSSRTRTEYEYERLLGRVVFSTNYAAALEYGTEKMEARPYARPSLSNRQGFIRKSINDEIAAALR